MRLGRRIAGLALLALLWLGPLPAWAQVSMTMAMVLHVGVVALAPALLAPRLAWRPSPVGIALATLVEAVAVWAWHLPEAHAFARLTPAGLVLEQASFLAAGLLLWAAAHAAGAYGGAAALLTTFMHMSLLGGLIALAPTPLYVGCGGGPLQLPPLADQQLAGTLMAAGAAVYLVASMWRLAPALSLGEAERP